VQHEEIIQEPEISDQEEVQESDSEEDEVEINVPIEVEQPREENRRVLRERTNRIKPAKYTAISRMEGEKGKETPLIVDEEEEDDLRTRSGKSNGKYEKKKRRLQRIKERKRNMNTNPVITIDEGKNSWTLDPFTKYAPSFSDFED
jgi:hypothetical protein